MFKSTLRKLKEHHFEWKHLLVLFIVLIFFQFIVSYIHKVTLQKVLMQMQDWYKQDSAEKLANLTTTSLELLLETSSFKDIHNSEARKEMIQAFNIILSQQLLQQNVEQILILVTRDTLRQAIDNGEALYYYLFMNTMDVDHSQHPHYQSTLLMYANIEREIRQEERIFSIPEDPGTFHVFVPLVPNGEFAGAVYMKIVPDFSFISQQLISSYDETAVIFSALILFGLMAMFYISSYTLKERDEAQQLFFMEREEHLRDQINSQKESLFTKRIYHTHHKAEKVMGFIKEDLRQMNAANIDEIKYRVTKYANFISRVIYDMKWYDPPLSTIRSPIFQTDLNEVIDFIIQHIFLRISRNAHRIHFRMDFDQAVPRVSVNEFVVWEILEPLIQNSLDHSRDSEVHIVLRTVYDHEKGLSQVIVEDDGGGISEELLERTGTGIKRLFLENTSTKVNANNAGYGCYIAHEIAKRCGWSLDAENIQDKGSRFILTIAHVSNQQG